MINLTNVFESYSKALFSTWFLYKPFRILFDCGEGLTRDLESKIFAIENIFLSHGHLDHISGLPSLIWARNTGLGDKFKSLSIYYPEDDPDLEKMKEYVCKSSPKLNFKLNWFSIKENQKIEIRNVSISAFATDHIENQLTLGYQIIEKRKKLKQEYLSTFPKTEEMFDFIKIPLLTYSGDTIVKRKKEFENNEILMHECTFLNKEDVKYNVHSSVEDVLQMASEVKPKCLLLYHFSTRYSGAMVHAIVKSLKEKFQIDFPVWVQFGEYLWEVGE